MNAIEQTTTIDMAAKVATVVSLFRSHFPEIVVDLSPWIESAETQKFHDPNSIDFGFSFPQRRFDCQSRVILLQISLRCDQPSSIVQKLHLEMSGHDDFGLQWRFSTAQRSEFYGLLVPIGEAEASLRNICDTLTNAFCVDTIRQLQQTEDNTN